MNMIDMKMEKSMTLKQMAAQNESWPAVIEKTENEDLKKAIEDLYKDAKETFNSVKLFHSDVQDELAEYSVENSEYDLALKAFRETRRRIKDLEESGKNPALLEELRRESKEKRDICNKEFAEAHKEAFEYVDAKRKMDKMRVDFEEFFETSEMLMEEIRKYNSRYNIPKFRNMDIGHFYKKIYILKVILERFKKILETVENSSEENSEISNEVYMLITKNRVNLDKVAQILYKRLKEKGQEKIARVTKKLLDIGLKGPMVRQFEANKFDITLSFSCEDKEMSINWNTIGLLPKLKSRVTIRNPKHGEGDAGEKFDSNLASSEDEDELVSNIANITQRLKE